MRVLFTTMPVPGHIRPLVPVAQAAQRRGHNVKVCTPVAAKDQVEAYGLVHVAGGHDWAGDKLRELNRLRQMPPASRVRARGDLTAEGMAGEVTLRLAQDVLALAETWRPDLVVRENSEFGGYLAAEALGLPHVSVGASGGRVDLLASERLNGALNGLRTRLGLPADPEGQRPHAYLTVSLAPPEFDPHPPPRTRNYRQTNTLLPDERLPDWMNEVPADRPLVLAAFGTIFPQILAWYDTVRPIIAGLGEVDCTAIVAVGDGLAALSAGPVPANVRLVDRVPQPLVLECCDLFVSHGGFNSIREALRLAVPMVVLPWLTDAPANAARCAELGVAAVIPPDGLTADAVRDNARLVLGDPGYRRCAQVVRRHVLALPGMDVLIRDLESIVERGAAVAALSG